MYLHGEFINRNGRIIRVEILTHRDRLPDIEVEGEGSGVRWTSDPVEITNEVNDTFDHLLRSSASIRLDARGFLPGLFCTSCMDAVVNIWQDDECVFAGYVEPQSYSQPFNEAWDEIEINCIDALSALQYYNYKGIGTIGVTYEGIKASAEQRTLGDLTEDIISAITRDLDIHAAHAADIWYDGSIRLSASGDASEIFKKVSVSELLFLGDTEDDVWTAQSVLEEIMRYLDLHIRQEGFSFRIFSWSTVKSDETIIWRTIDGLLSQDSTFRKTVGISAENVSGTDTRISFGETFNRISLTCETTPMDSLVQSPLDEESMTSPYTNRQLYMTEYVTPYKKPTASGFDGAEEAVEFYYLLTGEKETSAESFTRDWYVQVYDHICWRFQDGSGLNLMDLCYGNRNQQMLPNWLVTVPGAALLAFGSVKRTGDGSDNSMIARIEMRKSLVVSVNGNGSDDSDAYPNETSLLNASPLAVYYGNTTGGVFSPVDDDTTNYIVISGRLVLNALNKVTCTYENRPKVPGDVIQSGRPVINVVPWNDKGRYYTQQWWMASTPTSTPTADTGRIGLVPYTGDGVQEYEFRYSAIGESSDTISKVGVIACMLIIGDKCVVETGTQGQTSDFEWRTFKERSECASDDEYYAQCFTIGFDPKIGDKLIGTEFDIQNNIDYRMGLDVEGTAIPLRRSDRIQGNVRFMILGPVNTVWGEVTRRHPTWFRHTKWGENEIPLMAHVSSIFITDFEMKIYSDNGLINNADNSDLIYMSDTREDFVNKKDDITFRLDSALTSMEREELGISASINISTPVDLTTGNGLLSVYDIARKESEKPEKLYVDSYYREYRNPRILLEQKLEDGAGSMFDHYLHPALPGKKFFATGISRNLIEGWAQLSLKEIDND